MPVRDPAAFTDYHFAHFRLRSQLALQYLRLWSGPAEGEPDITMRLGHTEPLEAPIEINRHISVDGGGGLFFRSNELFIVRVKDGTQATVEILDPTMGGLMHIRLLTIPLGFMCYQLGSPPMHGGLVDIGGTVIAFCAPSGSGKSTLMATMLARGHTILSDDLCITKDRPDGTFDVYPGVGTLKLLPSSIEALKIDKARMQLVGGSSDKWVMSTRDMLEPLPRRLAAIVYMQPGAETLSIARVPLAEAPHYLGKLYYRPYLSSGLPATRLHGHFLKALRTAPLFLMHRPDDLSRVHDVAAFVEDFAAALPVRTAETAPSRAAR
jgi:hypothetical protein